MDKEVQFSVKTHNCGQLETSDVNKDVVLTGWVDTRRDHGGLIFIDLRDRSGLIQLVISPEENSENFALAEEIRSEYVLLIRGKVRPRPEGTINPDLPTGEIEILIDQLEILNKSLTPPFEIEDNTSVDEKLRLKYRYLDLRRPEMLNSLLLRHQVTRVVRQFLDNNDFIEIETPVLTKSTPEGARDYLVPSRVSPGHFYALPQSPQLFKQLLMVSGVERYYQLARCFRDEDLRADRQPEHTQIDIEMSFIEQDNLLALMEEMIKEIFQLVKIKIKTPFPRLTHEMAMLRYGSDKPDLRFGLEIEEISSLFEQTNFKVFSNVVKDKGSIRALNVPGGANFSRKKLDELTDIAKELGAGGLVWIQIISEDEIKSPVAKFFSEEEVSILKSTMQTKAGDLIIIIADKAEVAAHVLGELRLEIAGQLDMIPENVFNLSWVTDFSLFNYDAEEKRFKSNHHPFTRPLQEDINLLDTDPLKVKAYAYDLVLNGIEIGGGSLRIYDSEIQKKIFKILGIGEQEADEKFGFLIEAFKYGAPPHGGIAFGLDRLVMVLSGKKSIRDVIAFPKTQNASCLMTEAPNEVSEEQLKELHIRERK